MEDETPITAPISRIVSRICVACHKAFNCTVFYNRKAAVVTCPFCKHEEVE